MAKKVFLSPSDHGVGQNKCLHSGCYEDKHTRPIAEVCAKHLKNSTQQTNPCKKRNYSTEICN